MLNTETMEALEQARLEYGEKVAGVLARDRESPDPPHTTSGIPLKPLYTPADVAGLDYLRDLGFPGDYPCT